MKTNDLVKFDGKLWVVISINGENVKLKKFTTTRRITEKRIVNISEITI